MQQLKRNKYMNKTTLSLLATISAALASSMAQPANTTSISFQGALNGPNGQPLVNGAYTLVFKFYDSPAGGNQTGSAITNSNVTVSSGIASTPVQIDPSTFNGQTVYLGVSVNGGDELAPRILVSTVPYALQVSSVTDGVDHLSTTGNISIGNSVGGAHRARWYSKARTGPRVMMARIRTSSTSLILPEAQ